MLINKQLARTTWILLGWGLIGVVFYASLFPVPQPNIHFNHVDKVHHFLSYGILMLWFAQTRPRDKRTLTLFALIGMGVLIEFVQPYTGRMFDPLDMLANAAGALFGWWLSLNRADVLYTHFHKTSSQNTFTTRL